MVNNLSKYGDISIFVNNKTKWHFAKDDESTIYYSHYILLWLTESLV